MAIDEATLVLLLTAADEDEAGRYAPGLAQPLRAVVADAREARAVVAELVKALGRAVDITSHDESCPRYCSARRALRTLKRAAAFLGEKKGDTP